jgi:CRISPR/Cas system CMR subunit Cmr4 (Cas7 group RAMP superfamily)
MQPRVLFLFAETPVHAGGSEAVGPVDLPIQREASTGLPVIWGQSLKGALRQAVRDATGDKPDEEAVFGSALLAPSNARLRRMLSSCDHSWSHGHTLVVSQRARRATRAGL